MLIELYKDANTLQGDFEKIYPNVLSMMVNAPDEKIKYFMILSNDMDIMNKINGEVFRFNGRIITNTNEFEFFPIEMDGINYFTILWGKTNIPIDYE